MKRYIKIVLTVAVFAIWVGLAQLSKGSGSLAGGSCGCGGGTCSVAPPAAKK